MSKTRTETDSMGDVQVPNEALYGAQTQRAINNFKFSSLTLPIAFIKALALIKHSAATANNQHANLAESVASAIQFAADSILEAPTEFFQHQFPVDVFQTGSGTSSNMNINEVLARIASQHSGQKIHPNDDVNRSQSSNDVIPSAIQISSAIALSEALLPALTLLQEIIAAKAERVAGVIKTGRTHLMDAMPLSLSQELLTWHAQLQLSSELLHELLPRLRALPQGGTAIGTGINAPVEFSQSFCTALSRKTGQEFTPHHNLFAGIAGQEINLQVASALATLATTLLKIANDLRWMNSGPLAGLGEISLTALQPGSSIMPGKVNPVIPEAVAMIAAQVTGNHTTISTAAQSGNFQLNVMLPVIAYNQLQNIELLTNACVQLADHAINDFSVNDEQLEQALAKNPILVTALNPVIGYNLAAKIAKQAYQDKRPILEVALAMTDLSEAELKRLLDPQQLTKGGLTT